MKSQALKFVGFCLVSQLFFWNCKRFNCEIQRGQQSAGNVYVWCGFYGVWSCGVNMAQEKAYRRMVLEGSADIRNYNACSRSSLFNCCPIPGFIHYSRDGNRVDNI